MEEAYKPVLYPYWNQYYAYDDVGNQVFIPFGHKLWVVKEWYFNLYEFYY